MPTKAKLPAPPSDAPPANRGAFPLFTVIILAVVIVTSVMAQLNPEVLEAFRRNPDAIAGGQWWRLFAALFVHADGWVALIFNAIGIALIGGTFELRFGSAKFLLVYFIGGLAGQIAGYWWDPFGAGASVAMFSLIGAWAAFVLYRRQSMPLAALIYGLYEIAAYTGALIGGTTATVVLIVALAIAFNLLLQRSAGKIGLISRITSVIALAVGLLLTAYRDNHGPPILVGALLSLALLRNEPMGSTLPAPKPRRKRSQTI